MAEDRAKMPKISSRPELTKADVAKAVGATAGLAAINTKYWKSPKSADFAIGKSLHSSKPESPLANRRTRLRPSPNVSKLASRAASRSLGAAGLVVGAPNAIKSASRIDKEGGAFAARFGKFVEELTGMPSGSSWRPPTKKEQERDLSI